MNRQTTESEWLTISPQGIKWRHVLLRYAIIPAVMAFPVNSSLIVQRTVDSPERERADDSRNFIVIRYLRCDACTVYERSVHFRHIGPAMLHIWCYTRRARRNAGRYLDGYCCQLNFKQDRSPNDRYGRMRASERDVSSMVGILSSSWYLRAFDVRAVDDTGLF